MIIVFFYYSLELITSSVKVTNSPLTFKPLSDQHIISPYNITPESHIEVMRIREMITNQRGF